jgi:molybdenum cofactor synthesis domain-containing protein
MIPLDEARAYVLARVGVLPPTPVSRAEAVGLVVAEDIVSPEDVPPFANTAMDGFAVIAADTAGAPVELPVAGTLAAGADPSTVKVTPGTAVRIMTGAPMPPGADAIVMVERTAVVGEDGARVRIDVDAQPGDHVRPAGDDIMAGDTVVRAGTPLTAGHIGVLASIGVERVTVHRRPRVGILSTGDELVTGGAPLRPGQIRDSNRHALAPLVTATGCEVVDLGLVGDDRDAIAAAIEEAMTVCDALLTSGGVSMGDFDWVKRVLDDLGDMRWMQVAIKPAKPFAFGTVGERQVPVFGLPGNPVSSIVSFELLARPALRRMMGYADDALDRLVVRAVVDDAAGRRRTDGKAHFVRVIARYDRDDARFHVVTAGGQGSHQLAGLATANALLLLPDGEGVAAGAEADVMLLSLA